MPSLFLQFWWCWAASLSDGTGDIKIELQIVYQVFDTGVVHWNTVGTKHDS